MPIASEPVRRFGLGLTPGATPVCHDSLIENPGSEHTMNRQPAGPLQIRGPFFVQTMGSTSKLLTQPESPGEPQESRTFS